MLYKNFTLLLLPGEFKGVGGLGGSNAEHGGPGTVYIHKLPLDDSIVFLDGTHPSAVVSHDSNVTEPVTNRTLFIDNRGRAPRNRNRNITDAYSDLRHGASIAWVITAELPDFVPPVNGSTEGVLALDYLQLYGEAHVGFLNLTCEGCEVGLSVLNIEGVCLLGLNYLFIYLF